MILSLSAVLTGPLAIDPRYLAQIEARLNSLTPEAFFALQSAEREEADALPYTVEGGVATIALEGVMTKGVPDWLRGFLGGTDTPTFGAAVQQAASDPAIKAIHLAIDSPGGMVSGTSEAAEAVAAAAKVKPTHVSVGDCCASAALWVASQARTTHASPTSMIGSIGVRTSVVDSSAMAEKEGIKVHAIATGEHKAAGLPGTVVTESQLAEMQRQVDSIGALFQSAIAAGRKMKPEAVAKLADGRVWIGKEAVKNGLIDGLGSRAQVQQALLGYKPGRSSVKLAAKSSAGETSPMSKPKFRFVAAITDPQPGTEQEEGQPLILEQHIEPPPSAPGEPLPAGSWSVGAGHFQGNSQLQAELDAQKALIEELRAESATRSAAENRAACEAHMRAGCFPAADLDAKVAQRAIAPAVFDALMAERPRNPLSAGAMISGDEAVASVDPSQSQTLDLAIRNMVRANLGLPALEGVK